jgi:hypothetical protein
MGPSGISTERLRPNMVSVPAAVLVLLLVPHAIAQVSCNPAIDGTYCATAGMSSLTKPVPTHPDTRDAGLGQSISGAGLYEQPATLGAITFGSAGRCIGLIRRVSCKD